MMAIDYTRKRPEPPAAPPAPAAASSGVPSWYTPPEQEQDSAGPPVPPARPATPTGPSAQAPWPPPSAAPAYPPAYPPAGTQGYPPPAAPGGYPPPAAQQQDQPPPASQQYQPTASVAGASRAGGISLQKVQLTASAPQVSLTKSGGGSGTIRINLNWSQGAPAPAPSGQKAGGFFKRLAAQAAGGSGGVDLDLGCLYELSDGTKGVVQALGNSFGSLDRAPWIKLDGDDRTGAVTSGENMSVNLEQPGRFRRVLIFAMIYEGATNWAAVDGVVTLTPINGPQIEVRLDATEQGARICAVAQLINNNGDLVVQREVKYVNGGQSVLDRAYGWGMNWSPGRK
jgi:tellurite resistance protein TerA